MRSHGKREEDKLITIGNIADLVRRELRGKLPADTVLDESTRLEDLGLSSLQISEIVFTLEEDHGAECDTARAADVKTLGDVLALANEGGDGAEAPPPDEGSIKAVRA
jgi:acyl carrier protein